MAKKAKKKAKPAKKAAKPAKKKAVAKKTAKAPKAKKKEAKKKLKKVTKTVAKKKVAKPAKKKVVAKKAAKPVKKAVKMAVAISKKKVAPAKQIIQKAPALIVKSIPPAVNVKLKKTPLPKKETSNIDMDEEENNEMKPPVITYEPPKNIINRPNKLNPIIPKPQINKDKRTRYSDKELQEFKQIILGKLEEAQKDYELLKSTLSHKDDHGTDDTSPTFKLLEDGSDVSSKEETTHLAARQEKFIQNLQNALIRIQNKTYGICRATGKLISKERLRSVPHATLSIDAKLEQAA